MLLELYDPLKDEMIQIMNPEGEVLKPEWMPDISDEQILSMYKTMVYSRVIDTKVLQFQRQGRILTYAPNLGQEAAQVGSAFALTKRIGWPRLLENLEFGSIEGHRCTIYSSTGMAMKWG